MVDLEPLRGIPLRILKLDGCTRVDNLGPLRDVPTLTDLSLRECPVRDLEPLRRLRLERLILLETKVSDLTPLQDMPLKTLSINGTPVEDLGPLRRLPLATLSCARCPGVRDISPLKDLDHLETLHLSGTKVTDLEPLRGKKLTDLRLNNCHGLRRLEPLQGMPLRHLGLTRTAVRDLTPLLGMTSLKHLSLAEEMLRPLKDVLWRLDHVEVIDMYAKGPFKWKEFWQRYDPGRLPKK